MNKRLFPHFKVASPFLPAVLLAALLLSTTSCLPGKRDADSNQESAMSDNSSDTTDSIMRQMNEGLNSIAEEQKKQEEQEEAMKQKFVGTYKVKGDKKLVIKADGTCTYSDGINTVYGSWKWWCDKAFWIDLNFDSEAFENAEALGTLPTNNESNDASYLVSADMRYLYYGLNAFESKDPVERCALTKVN